ncbi:PH domain leucine-rich repeat-containing protein phosphatase 1 [Merluccius polli]|uniref:PH domain leucine-rich repeat-containing protein phosphatase 1 n=1 Tax=Merluccius polli TaxID=89951 RepID=A0AA47M9F2_MERPO|nr:PH domain leucine-rich repeat-containing protein phosphatase 1 [Merluccius polli]
MDSPTRNVMLMMMTTTTTTTMKDGDPPETDAAGGSPSSASAALGTTTTTTREPDGGGGGGSAKHAGLASLSAGKLRTEDDGGGGGGEQSKLFAKGLATTSLLQIAIRNGIYQNQVANAYGGGGMAKSVNMPAAVKSAGSTAYSSLTSGGGGGGGGGCSDAAAAAAAAAAPPVNPLLNRRRRKHKRNLSLGAPPTACQPSAAAETAAALAVAAPQTPSTSPLNTLSLDRKTFLRQKQSRQLQASDRAWVKADPRRGCVHVHDWLTPSYPRPVLCTTDATAREIAAQLEEGKAGTIVRMTGGRKAGTPQAAAAVDVNGNCDDDKRGSCESIDVKKAAYVSPPPKPEAEPAQDAAAAATAAADPAQCYPDTKFSCCLFSDSMPSDPSSSSEVYPGDGLSLGIDTEPSAAMDDRYGAYSGSDVDTSSTCEDFSSCGPRERRDSLGEAPAAGAGADHAPGPGPYADSPTEGGADPFESSSDDVETASTASSPTRPGSGGGAGGDRCSSSSSQVRPLGGAAQPGLEPPGHGGGGGAGWPEAVGQAPAPGMYMQVHGGSVWRLEDEERPLKILNEYLANLGFEEPGRVQDEGMNHEIGCLIRFYFGKPRSVGGWERVQLSGVFNVRKGKLALPVNRWSKRQVTLSGTCLIVSSVKHAHTGKMHILPLIGGKVEEVRRHSHCLAFSSAGPQSQTYYVSYDSYTEHLRWHRQAAKIASQRVSSVDLSCCSLEELPSPLFYSQDLTHLNLKHNFMSPHRGLGALTRFCKLRSLTLSNNRLCEFPVALCDMSSLTEINLSGNFLSALPPAVGTMHNLQTLLLDGNCLSSLPVELGSLEGLVYLGLSFNRFHCIPPVLEKFKGLERLCLAGNKLSLLDLSALQWLPARHVDLRLNRLQCVVVGEAGALSHVTQLDVRDAGLEELDLRPLSSLELLRCDRNSLARLRVSGHALKALHAAHNELKQLEVEPVPESLTVLDLSRYDIAKLFIITTYLLQTSASACAPSSWSYSLFLCVCVCVWGLCACASSSNKLDSVPGWVCGCSRLEVLDINHNYVTELPLQFLCSGSLRKLLIGWNRLSLLADRLERCQLEVLDVQHNQLTELPHNLFIKAQSLRYLNASANKLESLPPASLSEESLSTLQELYLTNNSLTDKCVPLLAGHVHLRVLHLAFNQLQTFAASKLAGLEQLEELEVSGNRLRAVPTTVLSCRRLHTLAAHSNCITVFPEVLQLPEIKCVDVSCNEIAEVSLPETLPAKLQELDLTGNPRLTLDHKSLELLNNIRCFRVDPSPSALGASEGPGVPAVWSHGYTEASGDSFCGSREALYGVFDGERNVEVPYLLQCTMGDVLAEELHKSQRRENYMTNTFLTMQRYVRPHRYP